MIVPAETHERDRKKVAAFKELLKGKEVSDLRHPKRKDGDTDLTKLVIEFTDGSSLDLHPNGEVSDLDFFVIEEVS